MSEIQYTCKFCKKPGVVITENVDVEWKNALAFLNVSLACNRCADYHTNRIKLTEPIVGLATCLKQVRYYQPKKQEEVEAKIMDRLTNRTRQYAENICKFCRRELVWDANLPAQIFETPDNAWRHLEMYGRMIFRQSGTS